MLVKKFAFLVASTSLFSTLSNAVPPGTMESENENNFQSSPSVVMAENSSSAQRQDDIDGFSVDQVQQKEAYLRDPEQLLIDLITDLRTGGKENFAFDIKITAPIKAQVSKFSPKTAQFLLGAKALCAEEKEIIDSMQLFMNYVAAKGDLLSIYTPQKGDSESDYLQRIGLKEFNERKEAIQDKYNRGVAFTLLDKSKQEFWFRAFYRAATESQESYEKAFSTYIMSSLEAAAKCYILTQEPQQGEIAFVNLCKYGFKGKCAAQKKEFLGAWFSKARKNSLPSSNEGLENSEEVFHLSYSSRLKKEYDTFGEFLTTYVNFLFGDAKDKVILQQKNVLSKLESSRDPEFNNVVNFTAKKVAEYIKKNQPAIKVTVKIKNVTKEKYKELTLSNLFDKRKEKQITNEDIKKEVRKILSLIFFGDE